MEFIDMWDLDVRLGELTVWRPTCGAAHKRDWTPDSRPASYLQQAHLIDALRATAEDSRRPSWLATVFELPGPLDTTALRTALLGWIDRHETLRSRLHPYAEGHGNSLRMTRSTLPPGSVGLMLEAHGTFTDPHGLRRRVQDVLDRGTDPLHWPSFQFLTVEHRELAGTTVYVGLDHQNTDGYSLLQIASEIRQLYGTAVEQHIAVGERRAVREDAVASHLDFTGPERKAAAELHTGLELIGHWRDFITESAGRLPGFPAPVTDEPRLSPVPQTGGLLWLLNAAGAKAFDAACRRNGGDGFSGVLACLALASRNRYGQARFRTLVPFHTRGERRLRRSLGWYVGLAPVDFPVHDDAGFGQVLKEAGEALRQARPLAGVPLPRLSELLGLPLEPRFMVSYMDIRSVPGSGQWVEWRASALRSRRWHDHEVYLWAMRSREGIYLSYRFPDSAAGRAAVPAYLDETRRLIEQAAG